MEKYFSGKNVVITGAASGIGRELALHLKSANCRLALMDIRPTEINELSFEVDVTDEKAIRSAAEKILKELGHVDIVVAAAGVGGLNPGTCFDPEVDRKTMAINYFGTVNTFMPFINHLKERKRGHLVGICSLSALRGLPNAGSYCASKAAQMNLLESLRMDLASSGISVTTIFPGFVKTPMTSHDEFTMPFMVSTIKATQLILNAIKRRKKHYAFPWQMSLLSCLNRLLPPAIHDFLLVRLGGKKKVLPRIF